MPDGFIYTVRWFRSVEEDDPTQHSTYSPVDQFTAEMQEAVNESGCPVGFFKVVERRAAYWNEWDSIRHIGDSRLTLDG